VASIALPHLFDHFAVFLLHEVLLRAFRLVNLLLRSRLVRWQQWSSFWLFVSNRIEGIILIEQQAHSYDQLKQRHSTVYHHVHENSSMKL
jgi:hypothetical protein